MNKIHGGNIYEVAQRLSLDPNEIIDFSTSINPLGVSKKAEKKIKENFSAILRYPDTHCSELTRTLAQFHGLANVAAGRLQWPSCAVEEATALPPYRENNSFS